ncbi:MAG: ATP-binding protein [Rhodocyclaceae bacterium]
MTQDATASFPLVLVALIVIAVLAFAWWRERRLRMDSEALAIRYRTELAHASRLVTVGELTASIAHEIHQPLGAILSNAEAAEMLLQRAAPPIDEVRQILADVRTDDMRATKVIRQLRALLGKEQLEFRALSLNEIVVESVSLVRGAARKAELRIALELEDGLPDVQGDRTQLQQVLLNLLLNAIDACHEGNSEAGLIIVRTVSTDKGVACAVLDRGQGLQGEARERAFESFYTTKPHGLGLGLSIVKTIIDRHNGSIAIDDRQGGGTIATFVAPAIRQDRRNAA